MCNSFSISRITDLQCSQNSLKNKIKNPSDPGNFLNSIRNSLPHEWNQHTRSAAGSPNKSSQLEALRRRCGPSGEPAESSGGHIQLVNAPLCLRVSSRIHISSAFWLFLLHFPLRIRGRPWAEATCQPSAAIGPGHSKGFYCRRTRLVWNHLILFFLFNSLLL